MSNTSIQLFKQAMSHRLGKNLPPVIHADGHVHTFLVNGKEWYYLLKIKKYEVDDEKKESAGGQFGTLAGIGETYSFHKGRYNLLLDISSTWDKFIAGRRSEYDEWFRKAWDKLEPHPDGQHRVHGETWYLPVRTWDGEIRGLVRTFPYFQIIDGSSFVLRKEFDIANEKECKYDYGAFVFLGELNDQTKRVVVVDDWCAAERVRSVTGLPVIFFQPYDEMEWILFAIGDHLPDAEILIVDIPPAQRSTDSWRAYADGLEPINHGLGPDPDDNNARMVTLDQILSNNLDGDAFDLSPLATPELNYKLETGAALAERAEETSFIIEDTIPCGALTEFHADGGIGKTTLSLQILGAVAVGGRFMDCGSQTQPVVVLNYENAPSTLKALIGRIPGADRIHFHENPPQLDGPDWNQLKLIASKLDRPVFLIDTLASACVRSDIASNADFAPVMSRMLELRNMGATIIILNHTLKNDASRFIGAQVIISQSDHVVSLTKKTNGSYRFGTANKTRYGHFEMALRFDCGKKLFVLADAPDQTDIDSILSALKSQSPLSVKEIADNTGLAEKKARAVLDRYEGHHWNISHGQRNTKLYFPV
ncbi:MAG: hypothetical protein A4E71_02552 [Smithella sp. PtaU1.Bin162]|nr:MAG: hypothetical protein A4E71_02552 [Smithella sp. PtaU1.Bin162]